LRKQNSSMEDNTVVKETAPLRKKLYVSHKDESVRMFKSNFMDFFSRTPYWVPLLIYVPVMIFLGYRSIAVFNNAWYVFAGLFAGGVFAWTLIEYFLHRFVFHYHPTSAAGKRFMFIMHGVHHDYPNDSMRLVMPPSLSLPLAIFFYSITWLIGGFQYGESVFTGMVMGYLLYDELHYATHHATWQWGWFQKLKKFHMKHHYGDPEKGFGVSSPIWDNVFGSTFKN